MTAAYVKLARHIQNALEAARIGPSLDSACALLASAARYLSTKGLQREDWMRLCEAAWATQSDEEQAP